MVGKTPVRRQVRRHRASRRTVRRTGRNTGLDRTLHRAPFRRGTNCPADSSARRPVRRFIRRLARSRRSVRRFIRCLARSRRTYGRTDDFASQRLFFHQSYKYLSSTSSLVKSTIHFVLKLSFSLTPLLKHNFLRISHSTQPKANPFGRKQEEVPIYDSTKPYFIPP